MYVYFASQGGFNDMLCNINHVIQYCLKTNRTLLIDTTKCCYHINFSDYFYFKDIPISVITDINTIRKIISDESLTIYPNFITDRNLDNWSFKWGNACEYTLNGVYMGLPSIGCKEKIIITSTCGGGKGVLLFKKLFFNTNIVEHVRQKFAKLPSKYIAIQIRNTDIKCNYISLYETNKQLIHSYETVYIATDDKTSIDFFRDKKLNVLNFTEFPSTDIRNLHYSTISGDTKIKDLICDMYIASMADNLLSNSQGGFINLLRDIRNDVSMFTNKFLV